MGGKTMRRTLTLLLLVSAIVGVLTCTQVPDGSLRPGAADAFAAAPAAEREDLRRAVARMVYLQSEGRWSEIYDLVDDFQSTSKDDFVRSMQNGKRLISFTPISVVWVPPTQAWVTTGCAVFGRSKSQPTTNVVATVTARRVNDLWRITPVAIALRKAESGHVKSCRLP